MQDNRPRPSDPSSAAMVEVHMLYMLPLFLLALTFMKMWRKRILPYPPGPTSCQILGNVVDLPKNVSIWENFTSLASRHGMPTNCFLVEVLTLSLQAQISYTYGSGARIRS